MQQTLDATTTFLLQYFTFLLTEMGLSTMWYFITVRTTACVVATHSISYWPQPFEATEHLD